jgi:uncharacterized protein YjbJ (UPF0337 family)
MKERFMNRDVLETQWPQIRDMLKEKFSNLTEDDIRQINGRYDQLVAKLQQKYGYSREEAEERIRNWNFDRFAKPRAQNYREEQQVNRRSEDNSDWLKWLLALGIPLLLIGSYFLGTDRTPTTTRTTPANQEQAIIETPADRAISNELRNTLAQQNLFSEMQNVQITTRNGIVTLSGTVSSREASNNIESAAQDVSGVRQVINNLQVR